MCGLSCSRSAAAWCEAVRAAAVDDVGGMILLLLAARHFAELVQREHAEIKPAPTLRGTGPRRGTFLDPECDRPDPTLGMHESRKATCHSASAGTSYVL